MNEHKDYVSKHQENGSIHISEDVIISLVKLTIADTEGVSIRVGLTKKSAAKDIAVAFISDDEITITCKVYAGIGKNIKQTAKTTQEAITSAVESVTGLKVAEVNIDIVGITLPKDNA